jgi:hypothetical protein
MEALSAFNWLWHRLGFDVIGINDALVGAAIHVLFGFHAFLALHHGEIVLDTLVVAHQMEALSAFNWLRLRFSHRLANEGFLGLAVLVVPFVASFPWATAVLITTGVVRFMMVPVAVLPLGAIGPGPGLFSELVGSAEPNEVIDVLGFDKVVDHLHFRFVRNGSEMATPVDAVVLGIAPRECVGLDGVPALGCYWFGNFFAGRTSLADVSPLTSTVIIEPPVAFRSYTKASAVFSAVGVIRLPLEPVGVREWLSIGPGPFAFVILVGSTSPDDI